MDLLIYWYSINHFRMLFFPARLTTVTVTDVAFNILPLKRLGLHKVAQCDRLIYTLLFCMQIKLFFYLFIWKPCTWLVKMTAKSKFCPDKQSSWPDIVRWLAVICSPVKLNYYCQNTVQQNSKIRCKIFKWPCVAILGILKHLLP